MSTHRFRKPSSLRAAVSLMIASLVLIPSAAAAQATLIRDVRVFDGQTTHEGRSVLIDGNRIVEDDYRGGVPQGARIVEGAGHTLLPGLIDAHVHAYAGLDDALLFGVTTVLDMFTVPTMTTEARARTAAHANPREADLRSAGLLATAPGGHGTQFGTDLPTLTSPEEADGWVAARIAEGSDYIKIVIEAGGGAIGQTLPTLNQATVSALVDAAHRHGRLALLHATTREAARMAIAAGGDGLVHFFADAPVDDEMLGAMKAQGMFVSPTFAVFEGFAGRADSRALLDEPSLAGLLGRPAIANLAPPVESDRIDAYAPAMEANIAALARAGIPILAGSDAPNPGTWFGVSLHRELALLVASGLSPQEALVAATSAPADAYRLDGHGRIADGAFADLLLVKGDPTQDIAATRSIVEVWKDGEPVSGLRAERRSRIAAASVSAAPPQELPADGRIARFSQSEAGVEIAAPFGNWSVSTDTIMGGSSTAEAALTDEGALRLTGTVVQGGFAQWAGIAWIVGEQMMAPVDLRAAKSLAFRIRGTAQGPGVMGFSEAGGQRPSVKGVTIGEQWQEVEVRFADLPRFDPAGTTMLLIGNFEAGDYAIEIADVRLIAE